MDLNHRMNDEQIDDEMNFLHQINLTHISLSIYLKELTKNRITHLNLHSPTSTKYQSIRFITIRNENKTIQIYEKKQQEFSIVRTYLTKSQQLQKIRYFFRHCRSVKGKMNTNFYR